VTATQDRGATDATMEMPAVPAEPRPRAPRLAVLDGLRLVAALMVALYHYTAFTPYGKTIWGVEPETSFPFLHRLTTYGWMGVELFFLISGFVICMSSWGRSLGGFFRSRITRLYPAYWPAVLITTAAAVIYPDVRHHLPLADVLTNLTMLNAPLNVTHVDGVYWSLWAEARFYLLFAVVLLWRGGLDLRRATLFGYGWLVAAVITVAANQPVLKVILQPEYAPLFVGGMAFYLIHRFGSDITLWGLVGAAYLLSVNNSAHRVVQVGDTTLHRPLSPAVGIALITLYYAVMAVIAMGWTSRIQWRWLTTAGLLTYPFYLLHENIGWSLIHGTNDLAPRWVIVTAVVLVMLSAAWLLHKLVEKPLAKWLKRMLDRTSTAGRRPPPRPVADTKAAASIPG